MSVCQRLSPVFFRGRSGAWLPVVYELLRGNAHPSIRSCLRVRRRHEARVRRRRHSRGRRSARGSAAGRPKIGVVFASSEVVVVIGDWQFGVVKLVKGLSRLGMAVGLAGAEHGHQHAPQPAGDSDDRLLRAAPSLESLEQAARQAACTRTHRSRREPSLVIPSCLARPALWRIPGARPAKAVALRCERKRRASPSSASTTSVVTGPTPGAVANRARASRSASVARAANSRSFWSIRLRRPVCWSSSSANRST
jgi:hypothetical protein